MGPMLQNTLEDITLVASALPLNDSYEWVAVVGPQREEGFQFSIARGWDLHQGSKSDRSL